MPSCSLCGKPIDAPEPDLFSDPIPLECADCFNRTTKVAETPTRQAALPLQLIRRTPEPARTDPPAPAPCRDETPRVFKYGISLNTPELGAWHHFEGTAKNCQIEHCKTEFVEQRLKLCAKCPTEGALCHVIEDGTGRKYCPVLIHDLFGASWDLNDVN